MFKSTETATLLKICIFIIKSLMFSVPQFSIYKNTIMTIAILPRVVLRIKAIIYTKNLELFLAHSKYFRSFYNLQLEELIIFLLT